MRLSARAVQAGLQARERLRKYTVSAAATATTITKAMIKMGRMLSESTGGPGGISSGNMGSG